MVERRGSGSVWDGGKEKTLLSPCMFGQTGGRFPQLWQIIVNPSTGEGESATWSNTHKKKKTRRNIGLISRKPGHQVCCGLKTCRHFDWEASAWQSHSWQRAAARGMSNAAQTPLSLRTGTGDEREHSLGGRGRVVRKKNKQKKKNNTHSSKYEHRERQTLLCTGRLD